MISMLVIGSSMGYRADDPGFCTDDFVKACLAMLKDPTSAYRPSNATMIERSRETGLQRAVHLWAVGCVCQDGGTIPDYPFELGWRYGTRDRSSHLTKAQADKIVTGVTISGGKEGPTRKVHLSEPEYVSLDGYKRS